MENLDPFLSCRGITFHELRRAQVWRGWNGCSKVSPFACLNFKFTTLIVIFRRSLPPLIIALFPGQQRSLGKLKAERINLANQVASLINDFGPKLYDDFDEVRNRALRRIGNS